MADATRVTKTFRALMNCDRADNTFWREFSYTDMKKIMVLILVYSWNMLGSDGFFSPLHNNIG